MLLVVSLAGRAAVGVPLVLNYQGHVIVADAPYEGAAQFKFALVDGSGASVWSNDGTSVAGSEPVAGVSATVVRGSYAIPLGDASASGMLAIAPEAFDAEFLFVRVWFKAGSDPFVQLSPDRKLGSVAFSVKSASADYATLAGSVETLPDISAAKVTSGVLDDNRISSNIARVASLDSRLAALQSQIDALAGSGSGAPVVVSSEDAGDADLLAAGYRRFTSIQSTGWANANSSGQPSARVGHSVVWTGTDAIVWGGEIASGVLTNTGSLYNASSNAWSALSSLDGPAARSGHSAVWTGSEMLVWGGIGAGSYLGDGKRFAKDSQLWTPMSASNAPSARTGQVAVWTGSKLVVWGGVSGDGLLSTGGIYDPATDSWTALTNAGAPEARRDAVAVWVDDGMVVFGGTGAGGELSTGAKLNFSNGSPSGWQAISGANAPSPRKGHSLQWSGSAVLVFGGESAGSLRGDGFAYDPLGNRWAPFSTGSAPSARSGHVSFWTGSELIVSGGETASGASAESFAYDPDDDSWRSVSGLNQLGRSQAQAVWTGQEALVFGGKDAGTRLSALQRIDPSPTIYLFRTP